MLLCSVETQRGPRGSTEAHKIFQASQALAFAAEMLMCLQNYQSYVGGGNWTPIIS